MKFSLLQKNYNFKISSYLYFLKLRPGDRHNPNPISIALKLEKKMQIPPSIFTLDEEINGNHSRNRCSLWQILQLPIHRIVILTSKDLQVVAPRYIRKRGLRLTDYILYQRSIGSEHPRLDYFIGQNICLKAVSMFERHFEKL